MKTCDRDPGKSSEAQASARSVVPSFGGQPLHICSEEKDTLIHSMGVSAWPPA